jgi:hypothetical protein
MRSTDYLFLQRKFICVYVQRTYGMEMDKSLRVGSGGAEAAAAAASDEHVFFRERKPRRRFGLSGSAGLRFAGIGGRSCGVSRSMSENSAVRERSRFGVVTKNIAGRMKEGGGGRETRGFSGEATPVGWEREVIRTGWAGWQALTGSVQVDTPGSTPACRVWPCC